MKDPWLVVLDHIAAQSHNSNDARCIVNKKDIAMLLTGVLVFWMQNLTIFSPSFGIDSGDELATIDLKQSDNSFVKITQQIGQWKHKLKSRSNHVNAKGQMNLSSALITVEMEEEIKGLKYESLSLWNDQDGYEYMISSESIQAWSHFFWGMRYASALEVMYLAQEIYLVIRDLDHGNSKLRSAKADAAAEQQQNIWAQVTVQAARASKKMLHHTGVHKSGLLDQKEKLKCIVSIHRTIGKIFQLQLKRMIKI